MSTEPSASYRSIGGFRLEESLLLRICRRYLGTGSCSAESASEAIESFFHEPANARGVLERLDDRETELVTALHEMGGMAPEWMLFDELLLSWGGTDEIWRRPLVSLSADRLLVFQIRPTGTGDAILCLAPFIRPGIEAGLWEGCSAHAVVEPPGAALPSGRFDPALLRSVAVAVSQLGIRVTRDGQIFKKHMERLESLFLPALEGSVATCVLLLHLDFLQWIGCVAEEPDGSFVVHRQRLVRLLDLSPDRMPALWRRFILSGGAMEEKIEEKIDEVLARLAEGSWVPEDVLFRATRRAVLCEQLRIPRAAPAPEEPLAAIRGALQTSLSRMVGGGLVVGRNDEGKRFFAPGAVMRAALAGAAEPVDAFDVPDFTVLPTFQVIAERDLSHGVFLDLAAFARLVSFDKASVFALDRHSVQSAVRHGLPADAVVRALEAGARHGVPDNVLIEVKAWVAEPSLADPHAREPRRKTEDDAFEALLEGSRSFGLGRNALRPEAIPFETDEADETDERMPPIWKLVLADSEVRALLKNCRELQPWQIRDLFQRAIHQRMKVAVEYRADEGRPETMVVAPRLLARRSEGLVVECARRGSPGGEALVLGRVRRACVIDNERS